MHRHILTPFLVSLLCLFAAGCATTSPNAEFVKTVNFSPLDTFSYAHTLVSDFDMQDSERMLLESFSESVLSRELEARDFERVATDGDFFVVTKWRKALTQAPGLFDSIDGPVESMRERNRPANNMRVRFTLVVEIYEGRSGELFWRSEQPNIFEAIQLTEGRVVASLEQAIRNFPRRVEKDPNLPSIE